MLTLYPRSRTLQLDDKRVRLTPYEFALLEVFVSHRGRALTRRWLLQEIWGYQSHSNRTRTVDAHVYRLRTKLDSIDAHFNILTIPGIGYALIVKDKAMGIPSVDEIEVAA